MTFEEANNMIDDISWFYGGESITTDDIVECREICHHSLEKQIPKKLFASMVCHSVLTASRSYIQPQDIVTTADRL